jgi:hypothetical protein
MKQTDGSLRPRASAESIVGGHPADETLGIGRIEIPEHPQREEWQSAINTTLRYPLILRFLTLGGSAIAAGTRIVDVSK